MKKPSHDAARRDVLQRYQTHRPTPFDGHLRPSHSDITDNVASLDKWYVAPCSITRDSESLSVSNWEAMLAMLKEADPRAFHHEVFRFGHWGPGWYEICLVRPRSKAWRVACEVAHRLERYPVLDEDDFSLRETEEARDNFSASGFASEVLVLANARSKQFLRRHAGISMVDAMQLAGLIDMELHDGCFRFNLRTDHRDAQRVRDAEAELLWFARNYVRES